MGNGVSCSLRKCWRYGRSRPDHRELVTGKGGNFAVFAFGQGNRWASCACENGVGMSGSSSHSLRNTRRKGGRVVKDMSNLASSLVPHRRHVFRRILEEITVLMFGPGNENGRTISQERK